MGEAAASKNEQTLTVLMTVRSRALMLEKWCITNVFIC
jgi:hypothetical protein